MNERDLQDRLRSWMDMNAPSRVPESLEATLREVTAASPVKADERPRSVRLAVRLAGIAAVVALVFGTLALVGSQQLVGPTRPSLLPASPRPTSTGEAWAESSLPAGRGTSDVALTAFPLEHGFVAFLPDGSASPTSSLSDTLALTVLRSADGIAWQRVGTIPDSSSVDAFAFDGSTYVVGTVAIGPDAGGRLWRSSDLNTWTPATDTLPALHSVVGLEARPDGGFVALTDREGSEGAVLWSADGRTWTQATYVPQGGVPRLLRTSVGFAVYAWEPDGGPSWVYRSTDGQHWDRGTAGPAMGTWIPAVVRTDSGLFAYSLAGDAIDAWRSSDGLAWTKLGPTDLPIIGGGAYRFAWTGRGLVAVTYRAESPLVVVSSDGLRWQQLTLPSLDGPQEQSAIWNAAPVADATSLLIYGQADTYTSADNSKPRSFGFVRSIASLFEAGPSVPPPSPSLVPTPTVSPAVTSVSGTSWSIVRGALPQVKDDNGAQASVFALASGGFIAFIRVPAEETVAVYRSDDGVGWRRTVTLPLPSGMSAPTVRIFTESAGVMLAAGSGLTNDGYRDLAWTSSDLSTWTVADAPGPAWYHAVAGGSAGFVAADDTTIWRSGDGRSWTKAGSIETLLGSHALVTDIAAYGTGFVAAGIAGVDERATIWRSSDGRAWAAISVGSPFNRTTLRGEGIDRLLPAPNGGLAALGGVSHAPGGGCGDCPRIVWSSHDGTAWVQGASFLDPNVLAVVGPAPGGFVAAGPATVDPLGTMLGPLAVSTSTDGQRWQRVPGFESAGDVAVQSVVSDGRHVLIFALDSHNVPVLLVAAGVG